MPSVRLVTNLDEGRQVWESVSPAEVITDLWDFRLCFHRHFQRPLQFIVVESDRGIEGFLPLCWMEEHGCLGYFPGEVWAGKTWLEQNRLYAANGAVLETMLACMRGMDKPYHLRYLLPGPAMKNETPEVDEIGYLFNPPDFGYEMEKYYQIFSHKSAKRIKREIAAIEGQGISYRLDDMADFDIMVRQNVERYGAASYFSDTRFRESFREAMFFLSERGWLRMTTVLIGGQPAAVDFGCVYRGVYTLLGGGTDGRFPGIAKLINTYHMGRACAERLRQVDFLCGDFSWKEMFHLTPRPLYRFSNVTPKTVSTGDLSVRPEAVSGQWEIAGSG